VTVNGEDTPIRPGSWNAAEAQEGSPEDLRDPTRVHAYGAGTRVAGTSKGPGREETSNLPGALRRDTNEGGRTDCGSETNKRPWIRGWEVVAPSYYR
jgi:hypothetical protein